MISMRNSLALRQGLRLGLRLNNANRWCFPRLGGHQHVVNDVRQLRWAHQILKIRNTHLQHNLKNYFPLPTGKMSVIFKSSCPSSWHPIIRQNHRIVLIPVHKTWKNYWRANCVRIWHSWSCNQVLIHRDGSLSSVYHFLWNSSL